MMGILILIVIAIAALLYIYGYQSEASTNTLRDLLAAGKWKQANEQTNRLISVTTFRAIGKDPTGAGGYIKMLQTDQFNYIPYSKVHAIDQLWVKYSDGHFGFSVQLDILEECKKNDQKKQQIIMSNEYRSFLYPTAKEYAKEETPKLFDFDSSNELGEVVELVMFWEKVGWTSEVFGDYYYYHLQDFSKLNYSIMAPKGHLPFFYNTDTYIWYHFSTLFLRRFKKYNIEIS
jgi:hypothetical protein